MKGRRRVWQMGLWLAGLLLAACGGDDYHYPDVKLEFLSAVTGSDGALAQIITDEGTAYPVAHDRSATVSTPDSLLRLVSNYLVTSDEEGKPAAELYAVTPAVSPLPKAPSEFEEGVKHDAAEVLSIWMGYDYLNMVLLVKAQNLPHRFHFVEETVRKDEAAAQCEVFLKLYHDAGEDVPAYTRRAYLSVPLRHYATEGVREVLVHFTLFTEQGEWNNYDFTASF